MKRSWYKIIIGVFFIFLFSCEEIPDEKSSHREDWTITETSTISYSKHARCRMGCRSIDEEEVREVLLKNKVNHDKTRISQKGESRAYEGITHDGQEVRIIASERSEGHIHIVTVIDLRNDWDCDCK